MCANVFEGHNSGSLNCSLFLCSILQIGLFFISNPVHARGLMQQRLLPRWTGPVPQNIKAGFLREHLQPPHCLYVFSTTTSTTIITNISLLWHYPIQIQCSYVQSTIEAAMADGWYQLTLWHALVYIVLSGSRFQTYCFNGQQSATITYRSNSYFWWHNSAI